MVKFSIWLMMELRESVPQGGGAGVSAAESEEDLDMSEVEGRSVDINIPDNIRDIIDRIEESGYEAYAVGGCVRDLSEGIAPYDWDICTSAAPEQVMEIFADMPTASVGAGYGTVTLVNKEADTDGDPELAVDITTFRKDGAYSDGRRPRRVRFVKDLKTDLARRDFTINAMAFSPDKGLTDPFGGMQDLECGVLRCVGNPDRRFREDGLRILRGLRLMSVYDLVAEPKTEAALRRNCGLLRRISAERIRNEFVRFMCGDRAAALLDDYREVFACIIPELSVTFDFDQRTPFHNRDVWHHILYAVNDIPPLPHYRIAMLMHDIAKPVVCVEGDDGVCHYRGHPEKGAQIAGEVLRRLKFPKKFINRVVMLVRYHDLQIKPEPEYVRKWLSELGDEVFFDLMFVRRADATGKFEKYLSEAVVKNEAIDRVAREVIDNGDCISLKQLAINGCNLLDAGFSRGKKIGEILDRLLAEVMRGKLPNERNALLAAAGQPF